MAKNYDGKITHAGAQMVKAPYQVNGKTGKTAKKTGTDLRSK